MYISATSRNDVEPAAEEVEDEDRILLLDMKTSYVPVDAHPLLRSPQRRKRDIDGVLNLRANSKRFHIQVDNVNWTTPCFLLFISPSVIVLFLLFFSLPVSSRDIRVQFSVKRASIAAWAARKRPEDDTIPFQESHTRNGPISRVLYEFDDRTISLLRAHDNLNNGKLTDSVSSRRESIKKNNMTRKFTSVSDNVNHIHKIKVWHGEYLADPANRL